MANWKPEDVPPIVRTAATMVKQQATEHRPIGENMAFILAAWALGELGDLEDEA